MSDPLRVQSTPDTTPILPPPSPGAAPPPPAAAPCDSSGPAPGQPPRDLSCMVGSKQYYRARHDDFLARNPGQRAPDYYLEFGEVEAKLFTEGAYPRLSEAGRGWLLRTFALLQQKIELQRAKDPSAFEALEADPDRLEDFSFATHAEAYLEAGVAALSVRDLAVIVSTPTAEHLIDPRAFVEAYKTAKGIARGRADAARATAEALMSRERFIPRP